MRCIMPSLLLGIKPIAVYDSDGGDVERLACCLLEFLPSLVAGQMLFLSHNQQCQSTDRKFIIRIICSKLAFVS